MIRLLLLITCVVIFITGLTPVTLAQGCPMCKTVAAAQSAQAAQSLNLAILVLLVPPVTIMSSILFFAFRRHDASQQPTGSSPSGRDPVSTRPM